MNIAGANHIEVDPWPHPLLRVDPDDPEHAQALKVAFQEALELLREAERKLLDARYALLSAGYRSTHPVCVDIDQNLVNPIARRLEFVHHIRLTRGGDFWPDPEAMKR